MREILVSQVKPNMVLAEDVSSPDGKFTLYKGMALTSSWTSRMASWGDIVVKIEDPVQSGSEFQLDLEELGDMLKEVFTPGFRHQTKPVLAKGGRKGFFEQYESLENQLKTIFVRTRCNGVVPLSEMERLRNKLVEEFLFTPGTFLHLHEPARAENYLYRHALDVAVFAGLIGHWMGFSREDVANLVYAGLVHDVGKAKVYFELLSKPGPLDQQEQRLAKVHVNHSYALLAKNTTVPQVVLEAVFQHHERTDGKGYPRGLKGEEIQTFAKVLAIADVYDALISNRYYKKGISPLKAGEIMMYDMAGSFDLPILGVLLSKVREFMVGEHVLLSNGKKGKIVSFHPFPDMNPVVEIAGGKVLNLGTHRDVDIMRLVFSHA